MISVPASVPHNIIKQKQNQLCGHTLTSQLLPAPPSCCSLTFSSFRYVQATPCVPMETFSQTPNCHHRIEHKRWTKSARSTSRQLKYGGPSWRCQLSISHNTK